VHNFLLNEGQSFEVFELIKIHAVLQQRNPPLGGEAACGGGGLNDLT
jgi:hypothetical protein